MLIVEEFSEYTWDMIRGLPKAYHEKLTSGMVEVHCKPTLGGLYYFADKVVEIKRKLTLNDIASYDKEGPAWIRENWTPPPMKEYYAEKSKAVFKALNLKFDKPTIAIQNKYTTEWWRPPANFIPVDVLNELVALLKQKYIIIYFRPRGGRDDYFVDGNVINRLDDYISLKENHEKDVIFADDYGYDYNTLQFCLEATADKHIAVHGGGACTASYFGGETLILNKFHPSGKLLGIFTTDSWLRKLSGAQITSVESDAALLAHVKDNWMH